MSEETIVPAEPSILDTMTDGPSVDTLMAESPVGVGNTPTQVQNVNLMANSLEQASEGKITYQNAITNLMTDGGYDSKSVRDMAATLYVRDVNELKQQFNVAAERGMVEHAENIARTIDAYKQAGEAAKEKAITKVTKEAATNLVASPDSTATIAKQYEVSENIGSIAGITEILDQWLVKKGVAPSQSAFLGTLGVALGGPILATIANPVVGTLAGISVGGKFAYDSFVTIPDAIEKISGIKKSKLGYADQINTWRQSLSTLTPQEALNQVVAVADYIRAAEVLPGEVGKVFTVMNIMRLMDKFDENEWSKLSLSLKTQEFLDRVGLGFDAAGALQLIKRGATAAKIASETAGASKGGEVLGHDILTGTNRMGLDSAGQSGYALSFDLKQFMPDGVVGMSNSAQKQLQDSLAKTLETLNERIRIADDPEAAAMRDFIVKNTERYNAGVVSTNMQTGELVLQHPSGAPFRNWGNAKALAERMSKETGLSFDVVPANDGAASKVFGKNVPFKFETNPEFDAEIKMAAAEGRPVALDDLLAVVEGSPTVMHTDTFAEHGAKDLQTVAKWMRKEGIGKGTKIEFVDDVGRGLAGRFDPYTNTVYIHNAFSTSPSLLIHEVMHSHIGGVLEVALSGDKAAQAAAKLRPEQMAAAENLRTLFKAAHERAGDKLDLYGFQNVHEMVSEALTNTEFQNVLKNIPVDKATLAEMKMTDVSFMGKVKTMWDALVTSLSKALGWTKGDDVFSHVINESAKLAKSVDANQQNMVKTLKDKGMPLSDINALFSDDTWAATALSHGWYVRRTGNALLHTAGDIESRFGAGLDPVHRASELSVHERTLTLYQEQKDRNALREFMNDGFKGLSRREHARVISALTDGDTLGKEFTIIELEARGLGDKGQRAYYTYRTMSNLDLAIKNTTLKENLSRRGFVQGYFRDGLLTHFAPAKTVSAIDEDGRMAYNLVSKQLEKIDASKLTGVSVVRTAKPVTIGGKEYTLLIGDNATIRYGALRDQIPNRPGSFRHYYTQDYFGNVTVKRMINGEWVDDVLHLRTSNSGKDIGKWAEGMDSILKAYKANPTSITQSFIESKVGKWEDVPALHRSIMNGEWDNYKGFGHHFDRANDTYLETLAKAQWDDDLAKNSGRGIRLQSIDTNKDNILDPIKAIQAEIANVARHRNIDEWRDKWVQTWWNTFSDTLPDRLRNSNKSPLQVMSDPSLQLSSYTRGDTLGKFAESQRKYILAQLGVKTLDERIIENAMRRFTDGWSSEAKVAGIAIGDKLLSTGHALRNADPLQFIRSFNFFTMLSAFNPAQLIVQAAGAVTALSVSPLHGMKAAYSVPLLRVALASDNPAVWRKLATVEEFAKLGVSSPQEFVDVVKAIRKVGLIDGIVATSMHSAEAGRFNMFTGMMNKLGEKSAFFFNRGEEFSRLTAFEVARREWIAANKGGVWNSDAALRSIVTRADDLTQNMTRSNLAFYQRGLASIPGQFLQYNIKLAANLAGAAAAWATNKPYRGFTMTEAASIFAGHVVLYGTAGAGLTWMSDELLGGLEKLTGRPATDDEKLAFSQGAIAAIINEMSQMATGEDTKIAVGSRLGVGEYYEKLVKSTMAGTADFWSVVLGPSYGSATRLGALKFMVDPFVRKDFTVDSFAEMINAVGKETISGWRNATKAYYAQMHEGKVLDKHGDPMVTLTTGEIIAQSIGFGSAAEQEFWNLNLSYSERKKAIKDLTKEYLRVEDTRLEVLKNEGESTRYKALTDFMSSMHSPLPAGDRDMFFHEVNKLRGAAAAAPFIDKQTKMRTELLEGMYTIKDQVTTRSRGLSEHKPVENK